MSNTAALSQLNGSRGATIVLLSRATNFKTWLAKQLIGHGYMMYIWFIYYIPEIYETHALFDVPNIFYILQIYIMCLVCFGCMVFCMFGIFYVFYTLYVFYVFYISYIYFIYLAYFVYLCISYILWDLYWKFSNTKKQLINIEAYWPTIIVTILGHFAFYSFVMILSNFCN